MKAYKCDACGEYGSDEDIFALDEDKAFQLVRSSAFSGEHRVDICDSCYLKMIKAIGLPDDDFIEADEKKVKEMNE